jgi:hypothetical protein
VGQGARLDIAFAQGGASVIVQEKREPQGD